MTDELKKLIELAIIDGKIADSKKAFLYKKAQEIGIEEIELDIYIDSIISSKRNILSNFEKIDIKKNIERLGSATGSELPKSISKIIGIISGLLAIISTFFPWLQYKYHSSFMDASSSGSISISGCHSGLAFMISLWILIGIILLLLKKRYFWVFGIIAFITSIYYIRTVNSMNVELNYGSYGGASYKWEVSTGYLMFMLFTAIFTLTGLISQIKTIFRKITRA